MTVDADYNLTLQTPREGFGYYLDGIIPTDIAIACGAFNQSMRQIRNITNIPVEKFAQVVINLETTKDLDVNGSSVPVDKTTVLNMLPYIALGSGPQGSYTMSDIFGAMSGLPYIELFKNTQEYIQNLSTNNLVNIYNNLYLATTWKPATATVNYTTNAIENPVGSGNYDYYYTVTGITVVDSGGGYTRDNNPLPIVTIPTSTVQLSALVDTDQNNAPETYGRITSINLVGSGGPIMYGSGASATPPNPGLTVNIQIPPDNGTGGWPGMNNIIQNYIDQANNEINFIYTSNMIVSEKLNDAWNKVGLNLKTEQRTRSMAFYPLTSPKNPDDPLSTYPTTQISFVDSLGTYSYNTYPHMYAQTLEAIADLSTLGGKSLIGVMREQRNQARLSEIGIYLDNNISDDIDQTINDSVKKSLLSNSDVGNLCANVVGNININNPNQSATLYTDNGTTNPIGYYDSCNDNYVVTNLNYSVDVGQTLQTGRQIVPGSFAASPYKNLIAPELNVAYTSKQLTPGTFTVKEAIEEVTKCNCECWQQP